jgi:pyruvate dehydrogenase E2 component (dihydrolipoamide acetyltransferase)
MAAYQFKLPDVGEGIHEGEIVKLFVKAGDKIEEFAPFAEIQTDKAVVEIPSPVTGTVKEVKVEEGEIAIVHSVIAVIDAEGEVPDQEEDQATSESNNASEPVKEEKAEAKEDSEPSKKETTSNKKQKVLAMPSTRKLARELGVDITQVTATGENGRITADDVKKFAEGGSSKSAEADEVKLLTEKTSNTSDTTEPAPTGTEERLPLRGIRRTIARRMVESKRTAAHVTIMDEVDATELVAIRKWAKPVAQERNTKLTYLPFIMKAVIAALRQFPTLNASIDDEKQEIVLKNYYHIGMATATDNGLMVPVLRDADRKSIFDLADEITDKAIRGRDMKLEASELKGSTFTISNIGGYGAQFFTPILNHPEVAILGVGTIKEKPVVYEGEIVARPQLFLSLTVDHRLVDGDVAALFLSQVKRLIESPNLLMMEMR